MTNKFSPDGQEMSVISNYGWSGVFSVLIEREQQVENPEAVIPNDMLKDPGDLERFNGGLIDSISDELGSFRKGADRIYRANVKEDSMHIRVYEDSKEYRAEIDKYNPSEGIPEAVKHLTEDIA